jgi:outer membrane protein TolC
LPPGPARDENENDETAALKPELPVGYALSLGSVLYLADAQNPNVALARERINEAYARVDRADALWLPSIRAGMNYVHHEGNVQDVVGNVFGTNKSGFYGGLGAGGTGSGSPAVPGVAAQFHLTDAIFQPKISGHQAASRQFGATAVRNDTLRNTAVAYLELMRAEQSLAIAEEALANTTRLVKLTGNYARLGQGLRSDYERMLAEQAIRESEVFARVELVRVSSARLAQLLHSDPSVRISSGEPMVIPLDLIDHTSSPSSFVATGLMRRPELAEQKHLVCEAVERLNREKYAPLVPSVLLGFSYGALGGGLGSSIVNTNDRWDADALAYWEVRNFGIGERAARNEMSSLIRQAQHREMALMDQVARETVEAHAQVLERQRRIAVAKQGIAAAERSFQLNENRIENAQGLPIESLQSVQALAAARLNYLNAVIDYNVAQFELCRATGWFESEAP